MEIWSLVFNQAITSFDGAIDLNICSVISVIDLYEIEDKSYKLEILKAIMECWRFFNSKAKKEQENKPMPEKQVKNIESKPSFGDK